MSARTNLNCCLLTSLLLMGMVGGSTLGGIICVNDDAPGPTHDGSSWTYAYISLQDGLDDADPCDVIWVATGTYCPTSDYGLGIGDRGPHFQMINGVGVYGGFPDTGDPNFADRDPNTYVTILSGDIGTPDDPNDNCYHVFYHPDGLALEPNAILDGFTITAGNANWSSPHTYGAGMYNDSSSPAVTACTFTGNSADFGGGMFNDNSNPTVTNCIFSDNTAATFGGGMYNNGGNPTITD